MPNVALDSIDNPFRRRRIAQLNAAIVAVRSQQATCRVIDIGGTRDFWSTWHDQIMADGVSITCVNMDDGHASRSGYDKVRFVTGDARDLSWVAEGEFDIAFSNSVIEHVGSWRDMVRMAGEVRRVAPRYIVQTPYFWFPIEPHMRAPLIHWLPESLSYRIVMARKLGFFERQTTVLGAMDVVRDSRMLDIGQMRALFPDAVITRSVFWAG